MLARRLNNWIFFVELMQNRQPPARAKIFVWIVFCFEWKWANKPSIIDPVWLKLSVTDIPRTSMSFRKLYEARSLKYLDRMPDWSNSGLCFRVCLYSWAMLKKKKIHLNKIYTSILDLIKKKAGIQIEIIILAWAMVYWQPKAFSYIQKKLET